MTERSFDDAFWTDPVVQDLSKDAKLLYAYAFTNTHCNQAGLYQITPKTIAFETGLEVDVISALFNELKGKLTWHPESNILWVKNFLRRQNKSPKFLIAAARCLEKIKDDELVAEFLSYNEVLLIPYRYPINRVSILPTTTTDTKTNTDVVVGKQSTNSGILGLLQALPAWKPSPDDSVWLTGFMNEFPILTVSDVRACRDRWDGKHSAKCKGDWKNRLRNWMKVEARHDRNNGPRTVRQDSREDRSDEDIENSIGKALG